MRYKFIKIIIFLSVCIFNNSIALIKEDLYNIKIKIPSKDINKEKREHLITQAFHQVLQKITGKDNVLDLKSADQYLSKYAYQDINHGQFMLNISFDGMAINQTLLSHNYKFLGENRPLTIIWSKSADINTNLELLKQIESVAKAKGLSIIYPMYDVLDLTALQQESMDDQEFIKLITQASKRYMADEIILVDYELIQDNTQLTWRSISNNWRLHTESSNYEEHAKIFVDNLMEYFIKNYVNDNYANNQKETIIIKITNVINLEDYARIENYLQNLSLIKTIHSTLLTPGEAEFEVVASGGKEAIKKAIATSNILSYINNQTSVNNSDILLYKLHF